MSGRNIVAAVIKSGADLGGTHPVPKIIVVADDLATLQTKIAGIQRSRMEQANASARQRGDSEPFRLEDFPVLWQGDPDDESLDPQFREWIAYRLVHPVTHQGAPTGWY